jgi:hypothetical protein
VNSENQFPPHTVERAEMRAAAEEFPPAVPVWQPPKEKPKRLWLALSLFAVTFLTCPRGGGGSLPCRFANGHAASIDEFVVSLKLLYKDPTALGPGFPFALA